MFGTHAPSRKAASRILSAFCLCAFVATSRPAAAQSFVQTPGQMSIGRSGAATVLLPSGKVLIAGGIGGVSLVVPNLNTAEIYDPKLGTFILSHGRLSAGREKATGTLLPNGKVLIAGGTGSTGAVAIADLYDPATDSFSPTATPMTTSRTEHTATLLKDGTVLIAGGNDANSNSLASAEIFDPATNAFTALANSMTDARVQAAAVLLQNGEVLLAGGGTSDASTAETYDPTTRTFTSTNGPMTSKRFNPAVTLLGNGRVLVTGGRDGLNDLATTDIYDPSQGAFSAGPNMSSARLQNFSTLLASGQVLVGGGYTNFLEMPTASAELYDPERNAFRSTSQPLHIGRSAPAATNSVLLQDGRVFVVGGQDAQMNLAGLPLADGEIYDPEFDNFTITGGLNSPRNGHTATPLRDGRVLITGGADGNLRPSASAEVYDPRSGRLTPTAGPLNVPRVGHSAVRLKNGTVLIVGGSGDRSAEIYNPRSDTFTVTSSMMISARVAATATLLPAGQVLIAGGLDNTGAGLSTAELYNPRTDSFLAVSASMTTPRAVHAAVSLRGGRVLLVGGSTDSNFAHALETAEIYDSRAMTFTATHPMVTARVALAAVSLRSGKVLVTGGSDENQNIESSAELFDPRTGSFASTLNSMSSPRTLQTATLLSNGTVLIAGGDKDSQNATATTDIYDPRSNSFSAGPTMTAIRDFQTATPISKGRVLIAGGRGLSVGSGYVWPTTELFVP